MVPPTLQRPGLANDGSAVLAGAGLALVLTVPKAMQVASTGAFFNPDDAMRLVELRDFMAGQGWYDLVPRRLSPDHPFVMHWSRLWDAPLAAVTAAFGVVLPPVDAERAMRIAVPGLLLLAALALMVALVRDLIGPRARWPAALLFAGCGEVLSQFVPGHIHHHGVQATLLLWAGKLVLDTLRPGTGWRLGAGAGAVAALSMGIGLQNLPFVIALAAIAGTAWVIRGSAGAPGLAGFGGGLAVAALAVFGLDVPLAAWRDGACDAFSSAHALAAGGGGCGALVLAGATRPLRSWPARGLAAAALALGLLALVQATYPACLHDPMAGVDPVLRDKWLTDVGEALPLRRLITLDAPAGVALALTLLCGLGGTLAALLRAPPARQAAWAALLLLGSVGVAGTLYQVRVAPAACGFLLPGVVWLAFAAYDAMAARPGRPALLVAILVGLCGNGAVWTALAVPAARLMATRAPDPVRPAAGGPQSCFQPAAYAALAALPPGLVLSTIDPGSVILASTPHSVLAAPYHRNQDGNRVALLAFEATPARAHALVDDARVTYLVLCRASPETADTAARAPGSLAAALLEPRIPAWLVPVGPQDGLVRIFDVVP